MVLSKDMKIAICFGLIMGAIISICNMCFAAEDVEIFSVDGLTLSRGNVVESSTNNIYYFVIEPGYRYTVTNVAGGRYCGFSNKVVENGDTLDEYFVLAQNGTYSFTYAEKSYFSFNQTYPSQGYVNVTREPLQGLTNFVDNLAYDLSYANLSGVLFFVVPIMVISILVGLGFYLLVRLLNRIKRAKGGA